MVETSPLIASSDIPQADVLDDVVKTVDAVASGAVTFDDIADYIGKVGRQGRYYRKAAEILGLLTNRNNISSATAAGLQLAASTGEEKIALVRHAVLDAKVFRRLLPLFEAHPEGVSNTDVRDFLSGISEPLGQTIIPRRVSSIISWLNGLGIVQKRGDLFALSEQIPDVSVAVDSPDTEPLLPTPGNMVEYHDVAARVGQAVQEIVVMRNQAAVERANEAHGRLVNLVAGRIRERGGVPRRNRLIDLGARVNNAPYIFEMKSNADENTKTQVRRGLSQLYEYRYLQGSPDATLVLVIENPLASDIAWMERYLEEDRGVRLVWDGNDELFASTATAQVLSFLWH